MSNIIETAMAFLSGGAIAGITSLAMLKPKKEAAVIENLKAVIDEIKEHYNEYKTETELRFARLEKDISKLQLKNSMMQRAINLSYRCSYIPNGGKCPVADMSDKICEAIIEAKEEFKK